VRQQFLVTGFQWALLAILGLWGSAALAEAAKGETPHQVVQGVTDSVMNVIKGGEQTLKEKPDEYFAKVRASLESTVSFSFIAKNVMASYWNQASEAQREEFTETFTRSMVETLGKGLANYSDLKIATLPPEEDASVAKRVEVIQEVAAADGTTRISYTMAQNKSGEWKLINVVLNGVNLGKSFRDQFTQAMKQNDNNIDKVIATWAQKA
jgi:phospholipid transport system substrate-binding protein